MSILAANQDLLQVSVHIDGLVSASPCVMGVYLVHVDIGPFYFGGLDGLEADEGCVEDRREVDGWADPVDLAELKGCVGDTFGEFVVDIDPCREGSLSGM